VDLIEPNPVDVPVRRTRARVDSGGGGRAKGRKDVRGVGKSRSVCEESLSADWPEDNLSAFIPRFVDVLHAFFPP
jgi:hypothetical protein